MLLASFSPSSALLLHVMLFVEALRCLTSGAGCLQGCMKSGQVLTDRRYKWFEPENWRFGDGAGAEGQINYMRHASGQIYGVSGPVAKYIGRNAPILHK